ncbi:alpha/beta fold hydrolase [Cytobacillus sp. NJ13]|nr:alpha/beta fold hydrolase [Cytobacillus sp. NJ13]
MKSDSLLTQWCFNKTLKPESKMRILFFPYACGGASIYRTWQNFFSSDIEAIPIQLPGRENRITENPYYSIEELADHLFEILKPLFDRPVALFGHSMGSLISYELSIRMHQSGIIPAHLFVSAHTAPHKSNRGTQDHLLSDEQLINRLRELSFTPEPVLQNKDLMRLLLPLIRADFAMCENYRFKHNTVLTCPVTVFGGTNDNEVSISELDDWKHYTTSDFSKVVIDGDHFFVHDQASIITTNISNKFPHITIGQ